VGAVGSAFDGVNGFAPFGIVEIAVSEEEGVWFLFENGVDMRAKQNAFVAAHERLIGTFDGAFGLKMGPEKADFFLGELDRHVENPTADLKRPVINRVGCFFGEGVGIDGESRKDGERAICVRAVGAVDVREIDPSFFESGLEVFKVVVLPYFADTEDVGVGVLDDFDQSGNFFFRL